MSADDKFPYKCSKCGENLSFDEIAQSIFRYGKIFLDGKTQCYFGYNCVKCDKPTTNLHQFKTDDWKEIDQNISASFSKSEVPFVYRSFPYNRYLKDDLIKPNGFFKIALRTEFGTVTKDECEDYCNTPKMLESINLNVDQPFDYIDPFAKEDIWYSYDFQTIAMGPAILVNWYRHENIQRVINYENYTGLKVIPRYIAYDPIYTTIDNFSWGVHLQTKHFDLENFDLFDKNILLRSPKKEITKIVDFLHILDIIHKDDTSRHSKPTPAQMVKHASRPLSLIQEIKYNQGSKNIRFTNPTQKPLRNKIWNKFNETYVQEIISGYAEKFVEEYIGLSNRIDTVYDYVWNLKQKYLSEIYKNIQTDYKRRKAKTKISKDIEIKVKKIENKFPAFKKIVSTNKEINQIKIDLYNWATLPGNLVTDILIQGETGTGKELFAEAFHQATTGERKDKLITVNCSAISSELFESDFFGYKKGSHYKAGKDKKGYFKQADGGTLFLDEIGDIAPAHQAKLLRVIENREIQPVGGVPEKVDVKVIFATERNLDQMVKENEFRDSLLGRFNELSIYLPPLNERKEDLKPLIQHFITDFATMSGKPEFADLVVDNEALKLLKKHPWKRNVRELKGVIKNIIVNRIASGNTDVISISDLPDRITKQDPIHGKKRKKLRGNQQYYDADIKEALKKHNNNKSRAAKEIGCSWNTIDRRLKKIQTENNLA